MPGGQGLHPVAQTQRGDLTHHGLQFTGFDVRDQHIDARLELITHIKPGELETVMREIAALGLGHRVQALAAGHVIALN